MDMRTHVAALMVFAVVGTALAQSRSTPVCQSLSDCDALIQARPSIEAYERRGYLHFVQRRGLEDLQSAITDFSAAIAIEARPFSLYARGMARLMAGDAAGQNEMEAAIMLQRDIAEEFKRYGD